MLTEKKRLIFFKRIFPILIISICLLMSIGYATVNDVILTVEGDAVAMIPEGIYVTDISYQNSHTADFTNSNINVVNNTLLNHKIILSSTDSSSYVKYGIEIYNGYDYDWEFKGVSFDPQFYDNTDITFTLDDTIHAGDLVKAHDYISFYVTFKYVDGVTPTELNNILSAHINYEFIPCAILIDTSSSDTSAFRAEDYRQNIRSITFERGINVPDVAIESWDIGISQTEDVMAFVVENEQTQGEYDLYIQSDTQLYGNEDMAHWFRDFRNVDSINGLSLLDTSNVVEMYSLFYYTGYNSSTFTLDVTHFDTSQVTDMSNMFYYTGYNSTNFDLDVRNFDTSKVTDMRNMFYYTGYVSTVFDIDVSSFNTQEVTDMSEMFYYAGYNSTKFTLEVSNFNTSKVKNMAYMFRCAGFSNPNFTLDVSGFDTSQVTDMSGMFYYAGYNSTKFELDVSDFDTSKVTTMSYMFRYAGYNNPSFTLDVSGFDTRNVTDMSAMFYRTGYNNTSFTLDVSHFDTSKVTDMNSMFYYTGYKNPTFTLNISNFNTDQVTDMNSMFYYTGYSSTTFTLDVSHFNTSNVTNMSFMFRYAGYSNPSFTLDLSNFDTSNVTDMSSMFYCAGYNSTVFTVDVSHFDTSKVTDMNSMFYSTGYSSNVIVIDVSDFDTGKVTDMSYMFYQTGFNASEFTLDLSGFDTSNVINMENMLYETGYNSTKLNTEITIKNLIVMSYANMFYDVATKGSSQIIVNYTNETSDLVDRMILTKSDNSNVVKGYNVDSIISFTIEDTTYNAYEGMTWKQWIDSEFNDGGIEGYTGYVSFGGMDLINENNTSTLISSKIVSGFNYELGWSPEDPI